MEAARDRRGTPTARARRAPRPARGQPLLAGRRRSCSGCCFSSSREMMVFGAFFTAYFFIRVVGGADWPAAGTELPEADRRREHGDPAVLVVHHALGARVGQGGNRFGLQAGILTTFLLGATFLFVQINEYVHIGFAPPDSAQGSIFYGLTGLHGAHVFIGLTLLAMVTVRAFRGHFTPEQHRGVEVPGIYWHFVDIMWMVVYTTVYILCSIRCARSGRRSASCSTWSRWRSSVIVVVLVVRALSKRHTVGRAVRPRGPRPGSAWPRGCTCARCASCARRGVRVPRFQIALLAHRDRLLGDRAALAARPLGDDVLSAHMAQHLLIADVAAPFALAGVRNPVLLLPAARRRSWGSPARTGCAGTFRFLQQPLVAAPLWVLVVYSWHLSARCSRAPCATRSSTRCSTSSFIGDRRALWWPVLEPKRRRMPGELWKIAVHLRGAAGTDVPGDGLLLSACRSTRACTAPATAHGLTAHHRPADGGRHDGRARHPDHGGRAAAGFFCAPRRTTIATRSASGERRCSLHGELALHAGLRGGRRRSRRTCTRRP